MIAKMTPRTLSGFMELLAPSETGLRRGPPIKLKSPGVNPADFKVFACGKNA